MIIKPRISEKTMGFTKNGLYTFDIALPATKEQIGKLVAEKFGVDVLSVKTVNIKGKRKQQRTRRGYFHTSPLKKAYVQVKKGQKIALFEAPAEEEVKVTTAEGVEKKNVLKGTKVKVEKMKKEEFTDIKKAGVSTKPKVEKEEKSKSAKQKSIAKKKGGKK